MAPTPRGMACSKCRQSKVKCNSSTFPCARCQRLGLQCGRDTTYYRVNKDRKIDDLEQEVRQLQQRLNEKEWSTTEDATCMLKSTEENQNLQQQTPESLSKSTWQDLNLDPNAIIGAIDPQFAGDALAESTVTPLNMVSIGPLCASEREHTGKSRDLGGIEVSRDDIEILFQTYFSDYHVFLPFLKPGRSPDEYYELSPVLFWCIIAVASRRYTSDITLFTSLAAPTTKLVWDNVAALPISLHTIQALLLLCTWPFPHSSLWLEPTHIFCNVALTAAMQLGLHQPQSSGDFMRTRTRLSDAQNELRLKTWAACNVVAQNTDASFGHIPMAPFEKPVAQPSGAEGASALQHDLRHQWMIQGFCNRVTKTMSSQTSEDRRDANMSIALLGSDLDVLEQEAEANVSVVNRIYLRAARLYLHIYYFFDVTPETIMKVYSTAEAFISLLTTTDASSGLLLYAPSYIFRMLFNAATVFWKVLQSSYTYLVDVNAGRKMFGEAVCALRKCSVKNNDIAGRQAEILMQMWQMPKRPKNPPSLYSRGRFGASLTYDVLCQWRDRFGEKSDAVYRSTTVPLKPTTTSGSQTPVSAGGQVSVDTGVLPTLAIDEDFNEMDFLTFDFDMPSISSMSPPLSAIAPSSAQTH